MNPMRGDFILTHCIMIVVCLLFSSCTKRQSLQQKNNNEVALTDTRTAVLDFILQQEAMLVDVPIPLYDDRIIVSTDTVESDTQVFGYKSPLSRSQATDFFMSQMERYGWQHLVSFESEEIILQFESPDRYCTIIIKNDESNFCGSFIFIYIKRASTDARSQIGGLE